jgi:hypothetical protein
MPLPKVVSFNLTLFGLALLTLIALHPNAWKITQHTYPSDSLFVLSSIEIVGLISLTSIMAIALFLINLKKTHWLHSKYQPANFSKNKIYWIILCDLFLTLALFIFFWAIAHQIHYLYYQQIMDGLQNQWVIGGGMRIERAIRFITLSHENSIADHANGLALWAGLLTSALYPILKFQPKWTKLLVGTSLAIMTIRLLPTVFL